MFVLQILINGILIVVQENLLIDQFFKLIRVKTVQLEIEIERTDEFRAGFILLKVQGFKVRMPKRIFNTNTLLWIKSEHFTDEIDSFRIGTLEHFVECDLFLCWQLSHEVSVLLECNLVNEVLCGHTDQVCDQLNLLLF